MKKKLATKKSPHENNGEDVWDFHPVKGNPNIVRLPIFPMSDGDESMSVTFDKSNAKISISEFATSDSGLISGTCMLHLNYDDFNVNMTYPQLCKVLFS